MEEQFITIKFRNQELKVSVTCKTKSQKWLVCLHGIQSNKELFKDLIKQPFFKDYSVLAIDFIGFGKSDKPKDFSYDLQDQADIVEQIIREMGIKEIYLIGHSLGGMIGILLLNPLEDLVKTFINAEGNLTLADCGLSKVVYDYTFEQFEDKEYTRIKADINSSSEVSSHLRSDWLKEIPDFAFYKTSVSIVTWAKSEKLLKIFNEDPIKKMFLYGEENSTKANVLSKEIKKALIPNAGHFMLTDNPKDCYKAIEDFL